MLLIRSIISTRRKNIGKEDEYVEENPDLANFIFKSSKGDNFTDQGETLDGPLTITFDNDTVHVVLDDDQALLMSTGIELDGEELGEPPPGEVYPGEQDSNDTNDNNIDPED